MANAATLRVVPAQAALSTESCRLAGELTRFGERRIFSPSYSIPQQAAAQCRLELADGVNPLQLTAYRDAMAAATGFSTEAYGVTLPPFENGDVTVDWHPVVDADALGRLNVETIVSAYPIEADGLRLVEDRSGAWTYRNTLARPRAWVESVADSGWTPATDLEWTPNRIRIRVEGPGRLVLSEIAYPGWKAQVDGRPALINGATGLLRSVELGPGMHEIVFTFAPGSMAWGAGIGVLALAVLAALKGIRR
jgi:hypothetical protein